ncbi:MAG: aldo/keto reductase, partial [Defluviitaleaceae bacterium]|nr:aldo/keto reductase [Defluviitaleaceae bacterium]
MKIKLNNGLEMPMLGLGVFRVKNAHDCAASVSTALQIGYRSIDTAAAYGNEAAVALGIKHSGIPRGEIFITTKLANDDQRSGNIHQAFETSLNLLETDYIDMYLMHWPIGNKFIETWSEIEKIYKSGRAKAIGVSNFNPNHLEAIDIPGSIVPAINQFEIHPRL